MKHLLFAGLLGHFWNLQEDELDGEKGSAEFLGFHVSRSTARGVFRSSPRPPFPPDERRQAKRTAKLPASFFARLYDIVVLQTSGRHSEFYWLDGSPGGRCNSCENRLWPAAAIPAAAADGRAVHGDGDGYERQSGERDTGGPCRPSPSRSVSHPTFRTC